MCYSSHARTGHCGDVWSKTNGSTDVPGGLRTPLAPSLAYQSLHYSSLRDALPTAFLKLACECFIKTPGDMWRYTDVEKGK